MRLQGIQEYVTELKVEQLTLLDNGIFKQNICTFDEKKVKKELTPYVRDVTFSGLYNFSWRNTLYLLSKITLKS